MGTEGFTSAAEEGGLFVSAAGAARALLAVELAVGAVDFEAGLARGCSLPGAVAFVDDG